MLKEKEKIEIELDFGDEKSLLSISSNTRNSLFQSDNLNEDYDAQCHLVEGTSYDYKFSDTSYYFKTDEIIRTHSISNNIGTILTNTHVGTLILPVFKNDKRLGKVVFEVQSAKVSYKSDYRRMLSYIADKSADLIMYSNSFSSQYFKVDYSIDNKTLYQKFQFIKSVIESEDFNQAIRKIIDSPITKSTSRIRKVDVRKARKITRNNIKELIASPERVKIPDGSRYRNLGVHSLPREISSEVEHLDIDSLENQFIKFILEEYLEFLIRINERAEQASVLYRETIESIQLIETHLSHSFFKEISDANLLHGNSSKLQNKDGYRELLQSWLIFSLASKLSWKGGDLIYDAGKRNVALLYEYWIFFVLLDILGEIATLEVEDVSSLFEQTRDGLDLKIKHGVKSQVKGTFEEEAEKLNIRFTYNNNYTRNKTNGGSWSLTMKPDYSLSFWPYYLSEESAIDKGLVKHIHFDAKYKLSNLKEVINYESFNEAKSLNNNLFKEYQNSDIVKMHAYKDAIVSTIGAYIIYPGDYSIIYEEDKIEMTGVGAFFVKPTSNNNGISELKEFLDNILKLYCRKLNN